MINEYMVKYYEKFDLIRAEQQTWFPVPDMLITKLIDLEVKRVFGGGTWKYDNAPKSLGDFGTEEPYGRYDYKAYKDEIRIVIGYIDRVDVPNVPNFDNDTKIYTIAGKWLWDMTGVRADHF